MYSLGRSRARAVVCADDFARSMTVDDVACEYQVVGVPLLISMLARASNGGGGAVSTMSSGSSGRRETAWPSTSSGIRCLAIFMMRCRDGVGSLPFGEFVDVLLCHQPKLGQR